jgi:hypothetical protein
MSYDAERWARSQKVGNASAKFVLIELANALNRETGKCYPSIEALQEATELNRKTVIAATKHLEEKGFITKRRSFVNGKQIVYYGFPSFKPADWESKNKSTKTGTLESTENGTTESTKNGTDDSTEIGTYESTVFGTVTRNKNKEKNKEIEQGSSFPAQALLLTIPTDPKPKATRAKPKTSCPFSPDDSIPPEYLEYAQAKHPSINAQTEFTKFVNFHLSKDNKYSDWLAAWRTWTTKAEEFASNRPKNQNQTFPFGKPTDPQYGIGVCQPPAEPPKPFDPEAQAEFDRKFEIEKQKMIEEGLIF